VHYSVKLAGTSNRRFKLNKRSQLFIRTHDETLSVVAVCVCNAIGSAKFRNRSYDAVIRVYDDAGNVIETREHTGEFKE
jgi:hypothetical protein